MGNIFLIPHRLKEAFSEWIHSRVDMTWPLPDFQKPHLIWRIGSSIVIPLVGVIAKIASGKMKN